MIIACPSCQKRYRIDPHRFHQDEITIRCKNCNRLLKIDCRAGDKPRDGDENIPDFLKEVAAIAANLSDDGETDAENLPLPDNQSNEEAEKHADDTDADATSRPAQAIKRPWKILVADDEVSICMLVEEILADPDYHVITAYDGLETFQKVKLEKPDLVILDLLMPKMTGFEVLKEIRAIDKDLPVLVMTAIYKKASQVLVVKELGASGYIEKPFSPENLLFRVKNLLKEQK